MQETLFLNSVAVPNIRGCQWQVFDVRATWVREFVAELAKCVETVAWCPRSEWLANVRAAHEEQISEELGTKLVSFPMQRGFSRPVVQGLFRTGSMLASSAKKHTGCVKSSPLLCTAPHYATLAEKWPGPVIYYVTDLFKAYGEPARRIVQYDQRMCKRADLVCPNSVRIADYLVDEAWCDTGKLQILPNATRECNVARKPIIEPAPLPQGCEQLERPIAGIVGNMAANIDWALLEQVINRTEWLSWLFVGPHSMSVPNVLQRQARERLLQYGKRVLFVGEKPYGALRDYARSFNVAVLPYLKREPTYSGSSTRFYEHLAACRPMLATRASHELQTKEEFLRFFDTPEQLTTSLLELRAAQFIDGREQARWLASRHETWSMRARTLVRAFQSRTNVSST